MTRSYTAPINFTSPCAARAFASGEASNSRMVQRTFASTAALSTVGTPAGPMLPSRGNCEGNRPASEMEKKAG